MKKRVLVWIIIIAIALAAAWLAYRPETNRTLAPAPVLRSGVIIHGKTFSVEIADTDQARTQGLSGRASLAPDAGMLFVFGSPQPLYFWMKDMEFPLDFVWIDDNRVIDLTQNVPVPGTGGIPTVSPKQPADKVLEINAGIIAKSGIQIGDEVTFVATP